MTETATNKQNSLAQRFNLSDILRQYGVLIIIAVLLVGLSFLSDSFLTPRNLGPDAGLSRARSAICFR